MEASLTSVGYHTINISTVDQDANPFLLEELLVQRDDRGQEVSPGVVHLTRALAPSAGGGVRGEREGRERGQVDVC